MGYLVAHHLVPLDNQFLAAQIYRMIYYLEILYLILNHSNVSQSDPFLRGFLGLEGYRDILNETFHAVIMCHLLIFISLFYIIKVHSIKDFIYICYVPNNLSKHKLFTIFCLTR